MTTTGDASPEFSPRYLLWVIFRHKWKVLSCFALLMGGVLAATALRTDTYRSEAKLLIQVGRESVSLDPTASTGQMVDIRQDRSQELNSELAILQSPDLCREVVRTLGPAALLEAQDDPAAPGGSGEPGGTSSGVRGLLAEAGRLAGALKDRARAALGPLLGSRHAPELTTEDLAFAALRSNLAVKLLPDSSVLAVSFDGPTPALAQRVVAMLIDGYLEKHIEVHTTPGSYQFFSEQSQHFEQELQRSEEELRDLKNQSGVSEIEQQRTRLLEQLSTLERGLGENQAAFAASQAKVRTLGELLDGVPEKLVTQEVTTPTSTLQDVLRQRILDLRIEEQTLLRDFTENSLRVTTVREQIAAAEELLGRSASASTAVTEGLSSAHQNLQVALLEEQAQLASLQGRQAVLEQQRTALMAELSSLNDHEVAIARLLRRIKNQEESYQRYTESFEQARVDQALQMQKISNVRLLQPATLPLEDNGPGRAFLLGLGAVLSALASLALAFVCEQLDQSIKTPSDARAHLRLTTLASIPRRRALGQRRLRKALASGERHHANGHLTPTPEFMELKDLLLAMSTSEDLGSLVLGVTSAQPGEGASTVSAELALALARQADGPVLLVDTVFAHPSAHQEFHLAPAPGLAECLDESAPPNFQASPVRNLWVLTAGQGSPSESALLTGRRFEALLHSWKRAYPFVVIDLPAVGEPAGGVRLASLCDAALLVVQADGHRWQVVEHARARLEQAQANVLGVVLNKRRFPLPRWVYRAL